MEQLNLPVFNLQRLIKKRGWIDIPSSGVSMFPLIKEGDICRFQPIESTNDLKKGDIILFVTLQGNLVAHRFCEKFMKNEDPFFIFKGDTNYNPDPPVEEWQIAGKLVQIKKRSLTLKSQGALFQLWGGIVHLMPSLPRYCKSINRRIDI
jgi:signal peptidase